MKRIAVVKVRGSIRVTQSVKDTMSMMNLTRVNHCVIIDDRKTYKGMLQKAKDWITWGEVSPENVEKMLVKRGKVEDYGKYKTAKAFAEAFVKFEAEMGDINAGPVFRLSPPKKGYKSTKKPFGKKGSLGNRKEAINQLLARMI
ncbi:50S ribosomal protein L30 [archaeon]